MLVLDAMGTCANQFSVTDEFKFSVQTQITCSVCKQTSNRAEQASCISVNVRRDRRGLQAAFENEMKTEVITYLCFVYPRIG